MGLFGLVFCYHPPPRHVVEGTSRKEIAKKIDFLGGFLSIAGFSLLLVGLQSGGYQFPWRSAKVLAPLIVGAVLLIIFVYYERFRATNPMIPGAIFEGQRVIALSFVIAFVAGECRRRLRWAPVSNLGSHLGMNFYSILNFYPLLLTNYYPPGHPILVGVRGLGYSFSILAGATIMNALLSYTRGHVRGMLTFCSALMTACGGALAAATPFNPGFATAMSTVGGYGIGGILVPTNCTAIIAAPDDWIATVTAISLSMRFIGGAIGNTVYFNIYNQKIVMNLPEYVSRYAVQAGLPQDSAAAFTSAYVKLAQSGFIVTVASIGDFSGVSQDVLDAASLGYRWAYVESMKYIWYASIPFGVIACVCCWFMPNMERFLTNRVAVDIH